MPNRTIYPYVDDVILIDEIRKIFDVFKDAQEELKESFHDNTIDPFSAFIEATCHNITHEEWVKLESIRQLQKTLQNTIGYFHQHILGSIDGWRDPGANGGYDSENVEKQIFAEIKNKHNTFNSRSAIATYYKMAEYLETSKKGYKGFVVMIVPKSVDRYQKPFAPAKKPVIPNLFEIDGASYYTMCTGDVNALKLLYQALPNAIIKAVKNSQYKLNPEVEKFLEFFAKAYG